MCYSALVEKDLTILEKEFGATAVRETFNFGKIEPRIFPGSEAAVIYPNDQLGLVVEPMRYSAYPQPQITNPEKYTTFNARRDNLTSSFWSHAFTKHHGFIVLKGFYEWVAVSDLLKAGVVNIGQVEEEFSRLTKERKDKIEAAGKKYKPTPTELKDPRFRQIIIEFKPGDEEQLIVPMIFSSQTAPSAEVHKGFAIITDDPPPEVRSAGHDRCPIFLQREAVGEWLNIKNHSAADFLKTLTQKKLVSLKHQLAKAA